MNIAIAPRTGLSLKSPVIAASGTFGYGVEFAARMDVSGLGAIICKGTTRYPRAGNRPLRLTETAAGMLNSIGLQNIGVDAVATDMAPQWAHLPVPVLVNVAGESVEEYVAIVRLLDDMPGVAGFELNVSCPNIKAGGVQFGTDAGLAAEVTRAVRQATGLPLIVKLSPNVVDIRPIAAAVETAGADGVSVANTVLGMAIDATHRSPVLSNVKGGLSGPAIKPLALYLVYLVAQTIDIPVIGVGGVMTGMDAAEFLLAGATAVQVGTALLLDPTAWRRIVAELEVWLRGQGVTSPGDVVGAANPGYRQKAGERPLTGFR